MTPDRRTRLLAALSRTDAVLDDLRGIMLEEDADYEEALIHHDPTHLMPTALIMQRDVVGSLDNILDVWGFERRALTELLREE